MSESTVLTQIPADSLEPAAEQLVGEETYVTRQPILDRRGNVFGYELLFHGQVKETPYPNVIHCSHHMLDTLSVFSVDRFTSGSLAFIPCEPEVIIDNLIADLPPAQTVLEIAKDSEPSPRLVKACRALKAAGFRIALADFTSGEPVLPLELVDFVKVNSNRLGTNEWDHLCKRISGTSITVVADQVHTQDVYLKARPLGIRYFQGFYFCNPENVRTGSIPANGLHHVEILRELFKDPLDLKTLCPLVMRQASLVYRVLRLVNSPVCGVRQPVSSIESAIMILGDETFRRVATLAIQCALNQDQSPEIIQMSLVRAYFCAHAAPLCGLDPNEQYLLGMLSLLPAMLRVPMELIVSELPLRNEIRDALLRAPVKEGCLLSWIESLEQNQPAQCRAIAAQWAMSGMRLTHLHVKSLVDAANAVPRP